MDARALILPALAIAGPTLLEHAAAHGVPVPAYVTQAQAAAAAALGGTSSSSQAFSRYLTMRAALVAQRGQVASSWSGIDPSVFPRATTADLLAMCDTFIAAVKAGYDITADGVERYQLTESLGGMLDFAGSESSATSHDAVWSTITTDDPSSFTLTSLGQALYDVVVAKRFLENTYPDTSQSPVDPVTPMKQLGTLAAEMDAQGYRVQGPPLSFGAGDALSAAGTFWANAAQKALPDLIGGALEVLAALAFSTPGLVLILGVVWWRHR